MAQTTLDRVTERVRDLADRTSEATNQALASVRPDRRSRGRSVLGRTSRRRVTRRLRLGTTKAATKAAPTTLRSAWQAGEFAGRLEGIAATIPNMTRLWLDRSVAQVRGRSATGGAKTAARSVPASIGGVRLLARMQGRRATMSKTTPTTSAAMMRDRIAALTRQAAGIAALSGGIATLSKWFSQASARLTPSRGWRIGDQASKSVSQSTRQAARQTAQVTRRMRFVGRGWSFARLGGVTAPLKGTQRRLRRSWRWVRLFTLGFAVGAIWAYLFAPRRPAAEQQQTATPQSGTTAEQVRSAAEM